MASWRIDLPVVSPATVGIQIASSAEVYLYTLTTGLNRQIDIPWQGFVGMSVGSSDKPLLARIRSFTTGGSGGSALTPVALEPTNTDTPRFTVNRYTTPPSAGEVATPYYFLLFPQSVQGHAFLHPRTNQPLVKLAPGRSYNFTITSPDFSGGGFNYFQQTVADD